MTPRERIYAAINNQPVDRIPFSFWKHFPKEEKTGEKLAGAVINFQKKFNFDLVKITPPASSIAEAWGSKYEYRKDLEGIQKGVRQCVFSPISDHRDWQKIKIIDPPSSILKQELDTIRISRSAIDKNIPIVHTVPNPLTVIKMLSGKNWIKDLKEHPENLKIALNNITETIKRFTQLTIQNGADGIFFYTHAATFDYLNEDEHKAFGQKYDLEVIYEMQKNTDLIILHIHGDNIMFETLANYPVQIINWHDHKVSPSLKDAKKKFKGAVLGGINEWDMLIKNNEIKIKKQTEDAIKQTEGKGLIIGPGCIISTQTLPENIEAIRKTLEN